MTAHSAFERLIARGGVSRDAVYYIHSYAFDSNKDIQAVESVSARSAKAGISCMAGLPRRFAEKRGKSAEFVDWIEALDRSPQTEFCYEDEMYTVRKPYLDGFMCGFALPNGVKLSRISVGADKIFIHVFGQGHCDRLEERIPDGLVRCNFFMPMVLGTRGVFYWWYPTVRFKHKYRQELKTSLFSAARELRALEPWILSGEPLPDDAPNVSVTGNSIYFLECVAGDECVVIARCDISATKGGAFSSIRRASGKPAAKETFLLGGGDVFGSIGNHEWKNNPGEPWVWSPKDENKQACAKVYPLNLDFDSRILNGVNFVSLDDSLIYAKGDARRDITADQRERFEKEVAKGLPIILCVHVPFWVPDTWMASHQYWKKRTGKFRGENAPMPVFGKDTEDFIAYLKSEPLLKAILSGHEHITVEDRFSPTAAQYLVAGSFAFTARNVLVT